jgi:hypothetical protein
MALVRSFFSLLRFSRSAQVNSNRTEAGSSLGSWSISSPPKARAMYVAKYLRNELPRRKRTGYLELQGTPQAAGNRTPRDLRCDPPSLPFYSLFIEVQFVKRKNLTPILHSPAGLQPCRPFSFKSLPYFEPNVEICPPCSSPCFFSHVKG